MITRIHKLIDREGISVRRFEQSINASNGLIRKAIANNTDVQSKWIREIAGTYPRLNLDWLIKGDGEMYREEFANGQVELAAISMHELSDLKGRIDALKILLESKEALIQSQAETIKSKNEIIEVKDKMISTLLGK